MHCLAATGRCSPAAAAVTWASAPRPAIGGGARAGRAFSFCFCLRPSLPLRTPRPHQHRSTSPHHHTLYRPSSSRLSYCPLPRLCAVFAPRSRTATGTSPEQPRRVNSSPPPSFHRAHQYFTRVGPLLTRPLLLPRVHNFSSHHRQPLSTTNRQPRPPSTCPAPTSSTRPWTTSSRPRAPPPAVAVATVARDLAVVPPTLPLAAFKSPPASPSRTRQLPSRPLAQLVARPRSSSPTW